MVAAVARLLLIATAASHATQATADTLRGVTYARTKSNSQYCSASCGAGHGAGVASASRHRHWHSTGMFVWLLRLCAVRLFALWLLRAGLFLQRHLPGHGPMGRMGIWPRMGRPSLQFRWWRKLSRRRRRHGQSEQLCTRWSGRSRRRRAAGRRSPCLDSSCELNACFSSEPQLIQRWWGASERRSCGAFA